MTIDMVAGKALTLNVVFQDELGNQDTTIAGGLPCTLVAELDAAQITASGNTTTGQPYSVQLSVTPPLDSPLGTYAADIDLNGTMQSARFYINLLAPIAA